MIFKRNPYEYEDIYRPLYEFYIVTIWFWTCILLVLFDFFSGIPFSITKIQVIVCICMILIYAGRGRRLYQAQTKLLGFKQEFIKLDKFVESTRQYAKKSEIWMGRGFLWTPIQTQRYHEVIKHEYDKINDMMTITDSLKYRIKSFKKPLIEYRENITPEGNKRIEKVEKSMAMYVLYALVHLPVSIFRFIHPVPYRSGRMGQCWIHGLCDEEETISIPIEFFKGHALILGTTGSGKTRMAELLNAQAIMRGECLIIIDPKGDKEMKDNAERACNAYREYCLKNGLPDPGKRFYSFHPAFPEESVRLNLLASIARDTDVAARITNLTPSKDGGMDPFVAFGWLAINTIAQAQLLLGENPSLVSIKKDLLDGMQSLTERAIEKFCTYCDEVHSREGDNWGNNYTSEFKLACAQAKRTGKVELIGHRVIFSVGAEVPREGKDVIQCWLFQKYENEKNASTISSLVKLFQHPKDHFAKMINNMLPILEMLSTGSLAELLSITNSGNISAAKSEQISTMDIIQNRAVLYVGLDSLSDGVVGGAIGSLLLSDLTAAAGRIYNFMGDSCPPINIFVDEAAECLNEPCIRLLNKGRGAKFRLIVATQTISDFESRLGSKAKAEMVLGNINNKIALRTQNEGSQEYMSKSLPETVIRELTHSQGQNSLITNPLEHGSTQSEQMKETKAALIEPQLFGQLPNCEYIANFAGGKVIKGRLPIIGEDKFKAKPKPKVEKKIIKTHEGNQKNDLDLNDGLKVD